MRRRRGPAGRIRIPGGAALVTGGGSGIGAALCAELAAAGARVVVTDLDGPAARTVAAGLPGPGHRAVQLDVTDSAAVHALVAEMDAEPGGLGLLVANAGITWGGEVDLLTMAQWDAILDVNVRGVVACVHAAYPLMTARGRGQIVLTASMAGLCPAGLLTAYTTTKHAVVGLGRALRAEAADRGVGVTVVCPAAVETPILDKGELGGFDGRAYYLSGQGVRRALDPAVLARRVVRAAGRDEALVVEPARARMAWRAERAVPRVMDVAMRRYVAGRRRRTPARPGC